MPTQNVKERIAHPPLDVETVTAHARLVRLDQILAVDFTILHDAGKMTFEMTLHMQSMVHLV
jgi:hypothetical protein